MAPPDRLVARAAVLGRRPSRATGSSRQQFRHGRARAGATRADPCRQCIASAANLPRSASGRGRIRSRTTRRSSMSCCSGSVRTATSRRSFRAARCWIRLGSQSSGQRAIATHSGPQLARPLTSRRCVRQRPRGWRITLTPPALLGSARDPDAGRRAHKRSRRRGRSTAPI